MSPPSSYYPGWHELKRLTVFNRPREKWSSYPAMIWGWMLTFADFYGATRIGLDGVKYRYWSLQTPCACTKYSSPYRASIWIPEGREGVVVGCNKCSKYILRISGFISEDWRVWISDHIVLGKGR